MQLQQRNHVKTKGKQNFHAVVNKLNSYRQAHTVFLNKIETLANHHQFHN